MNAVALDRILCLQLAVAWAGEGRCEPARLGWWATDLVDAAGGGDLFARLLPRTHEWAALEAVREAARRVDARARKAMDAPDEIHTLFHLGFGWDERINERLACHKRCVSQPRDALPGLFDMNTPFDRERFARWLCDGSEVPEYQVVPGGRQLEGAPDDIPALVERLAVALVPFAERYPMPFVRRQAEEITLATSPADPTEEQLTLGEIEAMKQALSRDHAKRKRKGKPAHEQDTCVCGFVGPVDYSKVDIACSALKKLLRMGVEK